MDRNKRIGVMSALIFLNYNGCDMSDLADKERRAGGSGTPEIPAIAAWLLAHSKAQGAMLLV